MSERTAGHSGLAHEFLLGGMPEARAGLDAAPEPKAVGAAADADALRAAYLDLLKLALCDLAGAGTTSVGAMPGKGVVSYELQGRDRRLRSAGIDWPLHGLTMVGLARLADLQSCVETVVRDRVPGDLIEAGVWRGGASILMRAVLDALGSTDRIVVVADSFEGFPDIDAAESDGVDYSYEFLVAALDDVRDNFARFGYERGVDFVPGFFEETLPHPLGPAGSHVCGRAVGRRLIQCDERWVAQPLPGSVARGLHDHRRLRCGRRLSPRS